MAYDHREIERKAQEKWKELGLYQTDLTDESKRPYFLLVEFPYPSGDLHIGHWYAFAVTDIYARLLRLRGENVLFPIGFDAFGLPAENAAIKNGVDPKEWTYKNIERMRNQLRSMGPSFDWSKEILTCEPSYYQWTQWLFVKLFEHNLAEHREASVKWCPKDQTVLANEQVQDGCCERCGTQVVEKRLTQWFLKITNYAERLLAGLDHLPWREEIKEAQRAWIGKSEGAYLEFQIAGREEKIKVFTTRPDTIFGATYVVLAPEHFLVATFLGNVLNREVVERYIAGTASKTERERSENKEKTGVQLEGISAINPATKEEIPIYIADYALASYGTGAVMAVPAHDDRDNEFAQKFSLPVRETKFAEWDEIAAMGGKKTTQYRIRDWLVSRQRYWGCPIPVVYDPEGKPHTVPSEHLPWLLPTDVDFTPTGEAPLASSRELKERVTRIFGEGWTPEYDTLDTFVDSSWYFLRYLDPKDAHDFSDATLMKKWLPTNRYSGGSEHTTMHLLYARFFMKALYDLALVPVDEPFTERFNRGLIMGPDGQKMSKSKGNVINPDEFVQKYGADAVRLYLAFIGPYNEPGNYPWNLDGVASMRKFLERIARLVDRSNLAVEPSSEMTRTIEQALARASRKIAEDGDRFKFNTGVAALMVLVNEYEAALSVPKETLSALVIMLAPFAPHLAEHLWEKLGGEGSVHEQSLPTYVLATSTEREVVVQVNGKRRGSIRLASDALEREALTVAKGILAVSVALGGNEPRRIIYIPGKILNLVV
jgi:leucyl-tRNA synthetase